MRNHVELEIRSFVNSAAGGVFSKGAVLCGGYWLWAWRVPLFPSVLFSFGFDFL